MLVFKASHNASGLFSRRKASEKDYRLTVEKDYRLTVNIVSIFAIRDVSEFPRAEMESNHEVRYWLVVAYYRLIVL